MTEKEKPSSPNIEHLRVIRGGNRGVITKATREIDELLSEETMTSESVDRLNVLLQQLNNKMHVLQDIDREILTLCPMDEIEREIEESETVVAKSLRYKLKIEEALRSHTDNSSVRMGSDDHVTPPALPLTTKTRLPKLVLPKFHGDVTNWPPFWDVFKTAVHENNEISKIDKFNYLNSLLEGAVAMTIQGLSLTEANYSSAVELLQTRFGNPQQIITAHMDELLKLPTCAGDRATSLRRIYDKINVHVRELNALGINSRQYGSLLIPVIMSKLPGDIRLRIARENRGEVWKMDRLMQSIHVKVEAQESSNSTKVNVGKSFQQQGSASSSHSTASAFVVGNE